MVASLALIVGVALGVSGQRHSMEFVSGESLAAARSLLVVIITLIARIVF